MKRQFYTMPAIEVEDVAVENGFTGSYGDEGAPGQNSGYNDYENEL